MALEPTPTKDTFPSTSEQSQQVAVAIAGESAATTGLKPAGNESMPLVAQGDLTDEIEASQAETTGSEEIEEQLSRVQSTSPYNAAGQEHIKNTAESLHDGEY